MRRFVVTSAAQFPPWMTSRAHGSLYPDALVAYHDFLAHLMSACDVTVHLTAEGGEPSFGYEISRDDLDLLGLLGPAREFLRIEPGEPARCRCDTAPARVFRGMRAVVVGTGDAHGTPLRFLPIAHHPTAGDRPESGKFKIAMVERLVPRQLVQTWSATLTALQGQAACVRLEFGRVAVAEPSRSYAEHSLAYLKDGAGAVPRAQVGGVDLLEAIAVGGRVMGVTVRITPLPGLADSVLRDLPQAGWSLSAPAESLDLPSGSGPASIISAWASMLLPEEAALLALPPFDTLGQPPRSFVPSPIQRWSGDTRQASSDVIVIGHGGVRQTALAVTVPIADLTKHVFVGGTTGSGKTTTLSRLAVEVARRGDVPITLIDPIRQHLRTAAELTGAEILDFGSLRSDLRFNPMLPALRITTYQHAELVCRALSLLFPTNRTAYELLQDVVRSLYLKKHRDGCSACGNLEASARRHLLRMTGAEMMRVPETIPTFADLETHTWDHFTTQVEDKEGSSEWWADTYGHFKRRWRSLRSSALADLFDVPATTSLASKWQRNSLIELGTTFSSDERNTLTLLLFSLLCQHHRSSAIERVADDPRDAQREQLRHLAVLDEAHRVAPRRYAASTEHGPSSGEALSTFVDQMMAEARADGLGLVLADQSMRAVSEGVIVNSGTKIVHRVVDGAEREAAAQALGLSEEQRYYLSLLAVNGDSREVVFVSPSHHVPTLVNIFAP
ncbi:helicase HerA domain-containing protein [Catellatospora citrea]|uniref:Helicase HerA central domain-containing protein n=1 Tax=Catellatospora citrea TaxID=53366 RepID=A0A8J3NYB6_9ACTN|nr:DUF87 domain-containing protein [Catellatospora citrea]RKE05535.1 hypothetical protein C8E86_0337 [Catellatospora citrea]GIF96883.1 hypothetical protein Cci01nite_19770 [Catellatospora citrea]